LISGFSQRVNYAKFSKNTVTQSGTKAPTFALIFNHLGRNQIMEQELYATVG
jgi:hypothetical protein